MTDGVIKGDGTSRLAKASGWPETYEEFKALAESSGIPFDLLFNAAGWQQLPTFLNKANLLQDFTATLLGLDPADDPTVDDAFLNVFLTSANAGLLKIQVYETGTTTPISGVHITGATDLLGGDLYADDNGLAVGMATFETSTLQVDTAYIDLAGQTIFSGATPAQQITEITLYATRVSNPDGKIETFTASTQKMFTNAVGRVDVHCVGAGAGGSSGYGDYEFDDTLRISAYGGLGGGQGYSTYRNSVSCPKNQLFSITIGSHGVGGAQISNGPTNPSKNPGSAGGSTSCLGVTANGGAVGATTGGSATQLSQTTAAGTAASRTNYLFNNSSLGIVPGGAGGGGQAYAGNYSGARSVGGDLNGGDGGTATTSSANAGQNAAGPGGGGGGGGSYHKPRYTGGSEGIGAAGGDGGDGIAYLRWFYA